MNLNVLLKPLAVGVGLLGAEKLGRLGQDAAFGVGPFPAEKQALVKYAVPGAVLAVGIGAQFINSPWVKLLGIGAAAGALVHGAAGAFAGNVDADLTSY